MLTTILSIANKYRTYTGGRISVVFGIATTQEAEAVVNTIATHFLQEGGLLTTLNPTGQQWDAPNGWAPLQWMAYKGLKNYGHQRLAATI